MLPTLLLVGADKGGAGKTTVARALVDFVATHGVASRVFDTETPQGTLVHFCPAAKLIDLESVAGQAAILDDIGPLTIVDIAARESRKLIDLLDRLRILDDAVAGRMNIIVLQLLDASWASLQEAIAVQAKMPRGINLFLVMNKKSAKQFEGWDQDPRFKAVKDQAQILAIPFLAEDVTETVQAASLPFVTFAADIKQSSLKRRYVQAWLADVFGEFKRLGLIEGV